MIATTKKECPEEVKRQLVEWQRCGWVDIQPSEDEITPKRRVHKIKDHVDPQLSNEEQWCAQLKEIARRISDTLNGHQINIKPRGLESSYCFSFNSNGFCKMMDELLNNYRGDISNYLHKTSKPTGVTLVFPFLGEIINARLFNKADLQKSDLQEVFEEFGYKGDVAIKKLSMHSKLYMNEDIRLFIEKAKMIGKKHSKA